ncbi:hypothetical protein MMC22_005237 [Lobaria immixta]|nr:hypothetical protein [Lobaria immixta]
MPSRPHDTTSSIRRGRPPPSSIRALTRLALREQLLDIQHSTLDRFISEHSNFCLAPPRDATHVPDPRGSGTETGFESRQVRYRLHSWSIATTLVPPPLSPRPPRPATTSVRPTSLPTPPPSPNHNNPGLLTARPPTTTGIPDTIALANSMLQDIELQQAMADLEIELQYLRAETLQQRWSEGLRGEGEE